MVIPKTDCSEKLKRRKDEYMSTLRKYFGSKLNAIAQGRLLVVNIK